MKVRCVRSKVAHVLSEVTGHNQIDARFGMGLILIDHLQPSIPLDSQSASADRCASVSPIEGSCQHGVNESHCLDHTTSRYGVALAIAEYLFDLQSTEDIFFSHSIHSL
jgi:hypothetical protein